MGKTSMAYADNKGHLHGTADAATIADLANVLGNAVIGREVLTKRDDIESILREHDEMLVPAVTQPVAPTVPLSSRPELAPDLLPQTIQVAMPLAEAVRELLDNRDIMDLHTDDREMLKTALLPVEEALGLV